jgi:hypothetical protein
MLTYAQTEALARRYARDTGLPYATAFQHVLHAEQQVESGQVPRPLTREQMETVLKASAAAGISFEQGLKYSRLGLPTLEQVARYELRGPAGNAGSADYPRPDPAAASARAGYEAVERPGPMKRKLTREQMEAALEELNRRKARGEACSWESVLDSLYGDEGNTVSERRIEPLPSPGGTRR